MEGCMQGDRTSQRRAKFCLLELEDFHGWVLEGSESCVRVSHLEEIVEAW